MTPFHWTAFLLAISVFALGYLLARKRMQANKLARFCCRPDTTTHELYVKYYGELGFEEGAVERVFRMVSNATEVPIGKLRPEDRFGEELAPVKGWEYDDGLVEIEWLVKADARNAGAVRVPRIETLDDLVRYLCRDKGTV